MKRQEWISSWNPSLLIACGVVLGFIAGVVFVSTSSASCYKIEMKDAPFGCWEFVAARYQTMITGLIAIAIAMFSARHIGQQLEIAKRQSATSAAAALRDVVRELEADKAKSSGARQGLVVQIEAVRYEFMKDVALYKAAVKTFRLLCHEYAIELANVAIRYPSAHRVGLNAQALSGRLFAIIGVSENDCSYDDEMSWVSLQATIDHYYANALSAFDGYSSAHATSLYHVWIEIRANEQIAVGRDAPEIFGQD